MRFIEIKDLNNCEEVKKLYEDSFPKEEKINFSNFFSGVFKNFKLYALYKNKTLLGMFHFNNTQNFVHLNYLAISKDYQSNGYGSAIISWLKKEFKGKTIVVDIEEIDCSAPNNSNRIKRKNFYKKNGFVCGEYDFYWEGTFMTYMNCGELNGEQFMEYIQIIFPTIIDVKKKELY